MSAASTLLDLTLILLAPFSRQQIRYHLRLLIPASYHDTSLGN